VAKTLPLPEEGMCSVELVEFLFLHYLSTRVKPCLTAPLKITIVIFIFIFNDDTSRHIPEDDILYSHRRENLKSYKIKMVSANIVMPKFVVFRTTKLILLHYCTNNLAQGTSPHLTSAWAEANSPI
jgi:hypothetical protein